MKITLSSRVERIKPSPTLTISALAAQLKAQGRDIISLGTGEPDFDTPDHVKQAAIEAINAGFTKYTNVDGTPELKQAIIDKFARDNGFHFDLEEVLVSCGGKQSFFNLTQALLNHEDEVIIPAPYWVSYPDMVKLAGGSPVIVHGTQAQGFKITPHQLESAITERTRLFVINSPSNPSGVCYSLAELKALGDVLAQHANILIATDDMYEHILWKKGSFCNILNACPELKSRILVLNGVSKAYAMTGWRIGYAAGPSYIIQAMKKVQSQSTSNPASISQVAAQAALEGDQHCLDPMVEAFKERHDFVLEKLNQISGISCLPSDGTFYAFPNVEAVIKRLKLKDDVALTSYLLDKTGVALVPGSAFGLQGHMRLSYATSMEILTDALARIKKALG
ncbi:MAG: pyridoxal phosphate-dependent aminotransferase [Gammaproteobacteria bacterium]|nr:pyridoxal phosphate-dependent aminotransferase [Gammaproteobacteria bacterium]